MPPNPTSEPYVRYLSQLLAEIRAGEISVPQFQRPLMWSWNDRLELLRSVRDGIPIGAVMVWRTRKELETFRELSGLELPEPRTASPRQYLIDGVQRLTTLFAALYGLTSHAPGEDPSQGKVIRFDLAEDEFLAFAPDEEPSSALSLALLLDTTELLRFQRRLAGPDEWITTCDRLARAFREYKVPVIPIETDDIDVAARTFHAVNSRGRRMSQVNMVHALTWSDDLHLRDRMADAREEHLTALGWGPIRDELILRVCKAALGVPVYRKDADAISEGLRKRPATVDEAVRGIARAAGLLRERCGVTTPELVPYELQVVLLAEVFRLRPEPDKALKEALVAWFWVTTYAELFASISTQRLERVLSALRILVERGEFAWPGHAAFHRNRLASRYDSRSARGKALILRLADTHDTAGSTKTGGRTLTAYGPRALLRPLSGDLLGEAVRQSPGGRFLVVPELLSSFRQQLLTGVMSATEQRQHAISPEAMAHLKAGELDAFVQRRHEDLDGLEAAHAAALVQTYGLPTRREDPASHA